MLRQAIADQNPHVHLALWLVCRTIASRVNAGRGPREARYAINSSCALATPLPSLTG